MKKLVSLVTAASMIMLVGCSTAVPSSGETSSNTSQQPSSASSVTASGPLGIAWWGTQAVHEFTLELCDKFTEKTNIVLEPVYASWGDYWQKMNTLAAAGDLPDIVRQDYGVIRQYATKGLLEPLDEYIASGVIDVSDVDPLLLEGGKIDGKLYGINVGSNALCMLYDAEMIAASGLTAPSPTSSWADFEKFCIDFKSKTGKYGSGLKTLVGEPSIFEIYARSLGEELYTTDGGVTAVGFSKETLVSYYESVKRMHDAGAVPKIDTIEQETSVEDSMFAKSEAAVDFVYTDMYASLTGVKGKQLGITIIPGSGATKGMYAKPSQFLSIAATSDQKDDAANFINTWINDSDINAILKGRRGVPISTAIAKEVSGSLDENGKATFGYMAELAQYSSPISPPLPSGASEVTAEFKKQMEMLLFGESNASDTADTFIANATQILDTANK